MNLNEMKTTDLRIKAREMGLKGLSSANKATLVPAIEAEWNRLNAEVTGITKPKGKRCEICGTRPIGRTAKADRFDYCDPCYTEAGWENTHSDSGHDDCPTIEEINDPSAVWTSEDDQHNAMAVRREMERCWICHPELNKASAEYVGRVGTSRARMVFTVPIKADGASKAAVVIATLEGRGVKGTSARTSNKTGQTVLTNEALGIRCEWDGNGRRLVTQVNGKNVRNVSELLRKLSA